MISINVTGLPRMGSLNYMPPGVLVEIGGQGTVGGCEVFVLSATI